MAIKKRAENRKQKENSLAKMYRESWRYIKESKKFIWISVTIFLLFFFIGYFVPAPANIENMILQFIKDLLTKTQGLSQWDLISFIFLNNVQTSFASIFFGIVLSIFPAITTISNGYLLGFVAAETVKENGVLVLWRLLPHGIFELPALFISLGLGIKMGTAIFRDKVLLTLKKYMIESAKVFVFVVIPLLIIAAIIEGTLIHLLS